MKKILLLFILALPFSNMAQSANPVSSEQALAGKSGEGHGIKIKMIEYELPDIKGEKVSMLGHIYGANVAIKKIIIGDSVEWYLLLEQGGEGEALISYSALKDINLALSELIPLYKSEEMQDANYIEQKVAIDDVKVGYIISAESKKVEMYWFLSGGKGLFIKLKTPEELQEAFKVAISTIESKMN